MGLCVSHAASPRVLLSTNPPLLLARLTRSGQQLMCFSPECCENRLAVQVPNAFAMSVEQILRVLGHSWQERWPIFLLPSGVGPGLVGTSCSSVDARLILRSVCSFLGE